ncbi:uncharacterized protein LOC122091187 [Macadamia integrifolia]|uniref:uncharacterized protein LOC122091187 n=1 Tax=Macadamia integrifolia TaxID=60698 RepID=UPI001C4F2749|nr:uncharacterized protein LOC122091187 [Macadamia integrifolia]
MDDFEAPSFSLGIDLDFDSEPRAVPREESACKQASESSSNVSFEVLGDDYGFQFQTLEYPPPVLKRLKRGPATQLPAVSKGQPVRPSLDVDDDIEELSSQEEPRRGETVRCSAIQNHSVSNSSKFQLHSRSVLTGQSLSKNKVRKCTQASIVSTSANLEEDESKLMFPNLTLSPLRRFQLLDSDSDEPSTSEYLQQNTDKNDTPAKERHCNPGQYMTGNQPKRPIASASNFPAEDLWKDFSPKKNLSIPTPALDEFCDEYFRSVKDKNVAQMEKGLSVSSSEGYQKSSISENVTHCGNLPSPPPAYQYFYHEDPRIQKLVRDRLPNFFPLGDVNNRGHQQFDGPIIDYRNQFVHRVCQPNDGEGNKALEGGSKRGKRKVNSSNAKEVSQLSEEWVNPKNTACKPKSAGKRRVNSKGHSAGHWYTGQDGKRVYVSKSGQDSTGRTAYMRYRKESGKGLKRSRKRASAKTKSKR